MNGNEHTFISIIDIPQPKNPKGINNSRFLSIALIRTRLKEGTRNDDSIKKGFRFLDLINIPNGRANIRTPKKRSEL